MRRGAAHGRPREQLDRQCCDPLLTTFEPTITLPLTQLVVAGGGRARGAVPTRAAAVFPNNWFTTHPAGEAAGGVQRSTLALYPLKCPNRRAQLTSFFACKCQA